MNRFSLFVLVALCCSISGIYAQKQALSIQGVLRDAAGASVPDASYSLTFRLYTVASGGTIAWTETQSINVVNGVYSATLGKVTSLSSLNYANQYWLGISINGQTEMTPRTELTLSPYAILAGVSGTTNIVPQSGNVGIGTISPASKLHVVASGTENPEGNGIYVLNPSNSIGQDAFMTTRVAGSSAGDPIVSFDISGEAGWSMGIDNSDANKFKLSSAWSSLSSATKLTIDNSGNLGLGTTAPAYKFDIVGDMRTSGANIVNNGSPTLYLQDNNHRSGMVHMNDNLMYFLNGSATNSLTWGIRGSYWPLTINMSTDEMTFGGNTYVMEGNVGIATTSPTDRLHVLGSVRFQNGYVNMNPTADASSGNAGVGGIVYSNVKLTVNSNQDFAGYYHGNVHVAGWLSKSGGSFKIDHPVDPENKFLIHSFIESPDMMNVYNGNITTDAKGNAVVTLPAYFQALNRDYRYQLTVLGQFAQAIVDQEIQNNQFIVKTDKPNVKVSWQVTGIRQDAYAKAHPLVPEVNKTAEEKGKYLNPIEHQRPASLQLEPGKRSNTKE